MKKTAITAISITLCFISLGVGVFIGRLSSHAMPRSESLFYTETKPPKINTYFNEPEYIDGKLNINVASKENLCLLPGIGEEIAQRIIDYRQNDGPFSSIDELLFVGGVGKEKLSKIYPFVTVGK